MLAYARKLARDDEHSGTAGIARWSSQPGSVLLADQKLPIQVPRVRMEQRVCGQRYATCSEMRVSLHIISILRNRYAARLKRWSARRAGSGANPTETQTPVEERWDTHADEYAHVREELLRAEQGALTELRTHERVSDYVLTRLERELHLEMMLLDSSRAEGDELNSAPPFEVDDLV